MAIPTFIQNSRINQVIYQIRGDSLLISARWLGGKFKDYQLDLHRLDPDYQPGITRSYALLIIPLITLLLSAAAIWGLMHQALLPEEALFNLYQWPILWFAGSLIAAIRGSRRIEYFRFNNHWGKPALTIIRERQQADECAAFIAILVAHIELSQSDLSPEERTKLLHRLTSESEDVSALAPSLSLWKVSIASGALATVLPLLPNIDYYFSAFLFPIVFTLCVSGAAICVFSFLAKESRRWFSLIGMALSLIPPWFY